ncbi:MAG: EVE domain-containing protein [candidate division FCPU426 bacterium]
MAKRYWLLKSEPDVFSIDDLKKKKVIPWDGVRNYTARNFMRDGIKKGDGILIYHSSCAVPGVAGLAEAASDGVPDPTQFDPKSKYFDAKALPNAPRWFLVKVAYKKTARRLIPLSLIKDMRGLESMVLLRQGRLSVQPVSPSEWDLITRLEGSW